MTTLTMTPVDTASTTSRTVIRPGILPAPGARQWVSACPVGRLVPGRGVAVLLPRGGQAALSPLLKQVFSLRTGAALDDPGVALPTYAVRVQHGIVRIGVPLP